MGDRADLDEMARRVIDANLYMTIATLQRDGSPWLSPVYFTPARYHDFYWVSVPGANHSRNVLERPEVQIVIFDSSVAVGGLPLRACQGGPGGRARRRDRRGVRRARRRTPLRP